MKIIDIWISQRNLKRAEQIPAMIKDLKIGKRLPPVLLIRTEDNLIQLEDGHHRLLAYWLAGREFLNYDEYLLVEKDQWKPIKGKIDLLIKHGQNG